jgi:hypothetical protein
MAWSPGGAAHVLLILIDTNVLSAMMRVAAEPTVEQWFDSQPPESAWTTQPGRVFWGVRKFTVAHLSSDRSRRRARRYI